MEGSQSANVPRLEGRNLVVLSDGTGNRGGVTRDSNVWRLYQTIDRHHAPVQQLVRYDDGVGTDDWRLLKLLGGALGVGLTRNVVGLYGFLVRHYQPGDRIYLLGFSRGAFTVRVLAGIIARCGLWTRQAFFAHQDPTGFIRKTILPAYRSLGDAKVNALRETADLHADVRVRFLGVWDTVDAVGMPVDELKVLLEVPPRLLANRRGYGFHDRELSRWVRTARQALSIDDDRRTFHPNVWSTHQVQGQREGLCDDVEQVWFAGAHSNVGGSYPKDGLAWVTLDWMLGETDALGAERIWLEGDRSLPLGAANAGAGAMATFTDDEGRAFAVDSPARIRIQQRADAQGRHYEPRSGPGMAYRYRPRWLEQAYTGEGHGWAAWLKYLPALSDAWQDRLGIPRLTPAPHSIPVHVSAYRRLLQGTQDYAPHVMPANVEIAYTRAPSPFAAPESGEAEALPEADAARRAARAPVAWRRFGYALIVAGLLLLLPGLGHLFPGLLFGQPAEPESWWATLEDIAADPWLRAGLLLVLPGMLLSWLAQRSLRRRTSRAWRDVLLRAGLLP